MFDFIGEVLIEGVGECFCRCFRGLRDEPAGAGAEPVEPLPRLDSKAVEERSAIAARGGGIRARAAAAMDAHRAARGRQSS